MAGTVSCCCKGRVRCCNIDSRLCVVCLSLIVNDLSDQPVNVNMDQ